MERVTLTVPRKQLEMLDILVGLGDFPSVSEAIRAGVRDLIERRCGGGKFCNNISESNRETAGNR